VRSIEDWFPAGSVRNGSEELEGASSLGFLGGDSRAIFVREICERRGRRGNAGAPHREHLMADPPHAHSICGVERKGRGRRIIAKKSVINSSGARDKGGGEKGEAC